MQSERVLTNQFPPSIADHMYRMAILAMCTSDQGLDVAK